MSSVWDWSTTAANNANSDGSINWAEGQPPSSVNNSARVMMARIKELLNDLGGISVATGTANAISVAASSAVTANANGIVVTFRAANTNGGATTLNVNSIGAKPLVRFTFEGEKICPVARSSRIAFMRQSIAPSSAGAMEPGSSRTRPRLKGCRPALVARSLVGPSRLAGCCAMAPLSAERPTLGFSQRSARHGAAGTGQRRSTCPMDKTNSSVVRAALCHSGQSKLILSGRIHTAPVLQQPATIHTVFPMAGPAAALVLKMALRRAEPSPRSPLAPTHTTSMFRRQVEPKPGRVTSLHTGSSRRERHPRLRNF